ncbi:MAG TPA: NAD-dependent epimerase/dehydratase family protein [Candidatus Limnocylindria bacterium]|nr:NAD-dependent epimerase/dehydratase family protein [Candidatus Limnocylindria bacterium]
MVTGGAGFVGSTLVERLLAEGWRVVAFDSFDPYYDPGIKERNLRAATGHEKFELVRGDTTNAGDIGAAVATIRPEVVFDLAARAGVRPSILNPAAYMTTNVVGLQNTLVAAANVGAKVVFASSSSIYGADDRRPFSEDQARGRPESPYGASKIAGEAACYAHHVSTALPVAVARLFTVYGPRQRPDLAIHSFARQMLAGRTIDVFDHGRGMRDYTYVDDVVEAFVRLADAPDPFLLVNIGSEHPVRTADLIDELERALGVEAVRRLLPAQPGDVPATYADVGRARERLGWSPRMPFGEGIERFCVWLRAEMDREGLRAD